MSVDTTTTTTTGHGKVYTLIGPDGRPYSGSEKGTFGGHRGLKIYGLLDCPSARRHIAAGAYVAQRVFFNDEATAIAAGYRPCGICMRHAYGRWKAERAAREAAHDAPPAPTSRR